MLRVKMFSTGMYGGEIKGLQDAINGWLESAHPAIRQVTQSSSAEHIVVTFLYDEGFFDTSPRTASAEVPEAFEQSLKGAHLDPVDDEPGLLPNAELPY
ncbi:MAG TPA: hypothetical protein VF040_19935 [Ktedonobacterales bacterium]